MSSSYYVKTFKDQDGTQEYKRKFIVWQHHTTGEVMLYATHTKDIKDGMTRLNLGEHDGLKALRDLLNEVIEGKMATEALMGEQWDAFNEMRFK
jgi:hypothetical protein